MTCQRRVREAIDATLNLDVPEQAFGRAVMAQLGANDFELDIDA